MENRIMASIFLFALLLGSCDQKTFDRREELLAYIDDPDNGYKQHKNINGVDFSITYRPTDLLVRQKLGEGASKMELDSLRSKYGKYLYFNVTLGKNNREVLNGLVHNRTDFGAMVNQLAFDMGAQVHLYSKTKDTVALADYVYPRLYGMGGGTSMLFVYPREDKIMQNEFFHFTIEDIGLNTGEVGFKVPTDPIHREPKLRFN